MNNRLFREKRTIERMIRIYCTERHKSKHGLCSECKGLLEYAVSRLNSCIFGNEKPVCARCIVHCYKQDMRDMVKQVMRYSGRRMLLRHPIMTVRHIIDSLSYGNNNAFIDTK